MEHVILGLLHIRDMSEPDMTSLISKALPFVYWDNESSINTAIRSLSQATKIASKDHVEKGEHKVVYSITKLGKDEFSEWLKVPMAPDKARNMELSKLFFMGLAHKSDRVNAIQGYIDKLKVMKESMLAVKMLFSNLYSDKMTKPLSDKESDVMEFQLYTLEYGVSRIDFEVEWYEKLIYKIGR